MKLRNWQSECINSAISKYQKFNKHFLALATPGAGKTHMASVLAKQMHELGLIDLVICFSPSSVVSSDFSESLVEQFRTHFDGTIGALGDSFTYQKLGSIPDRTWKLFDQYRVFVIFDEIHHCAGSNEHDTNTWGSTIIDKIKDKSAFSIALTGTPWRSDSLPIALSEYCKKSGKVICNYIYGLKQAVLDGVCRIPQIVAVDNDRITVTDNDEQQSFNSFLDLLSQKIIPYSQIVNNELVIKQVLRRAIDKLVEIRTINDDAGGLVVASSIAHARNIKRIMNTVFGVDSIIVTSDESKPNTIIKQFRKSKDMWLISVGMVSEGTNIPRLQVCCNLTNVKTEMYFRQILGRILRKTDGLNQETYMFIPAEPSLVEYAYRIAQDIPDGLSRVEFTNMDEELTTDITETDNNGECVVLDNNDDDTIIDHEVDTFDPIEPEEIDDPLPIDDPEEIDDPLPIGEKEVEEKDERILGIIGRFKHKQLEIEDFELYQISSNSMDKLKVLNSVNL
jgi:superfamily II DNA or RNA helicase